MASLTIRKLDDTIKAELRLRAARSGRWVEDEVRVILREASQNRPGFAATPSQAAPIARDNPHRVVSAGQLRITLIIGGGIAASQALDLIRRLKERRFFVRCVLTNAAQKFVTPLAASALSHERCYTDLFDPDRAVDAGHIRVPGATDLIVGR